MNRLQSKSWQTMTSIQINNCKYDILDEALTMPKRPLSLYQSLMEVITSSNRLILTTFPATLDTKIKRQWRFHMSTFGNMWAKKVNNVIYIYISINKYKQNIPYPSQKASSRNFDGRTLAPSHTNPWNSWFGSTLCHKKSMLKKKNTCQTTATPPPTPPKQIYK